MFFGNYDGLVGDWLSGPNPFSQVALILSLLVVFDFGVCLFLYLCLSFPSSFYLFICFFLSLSLFKGKVPFPRAALSSTAKSSLTRIQKVLGGNVLGLLVGPFKFHFARVSASQARPI